MNIGCSQNNSQYTDHLSRNFERLTEAADKILADVKAANPTSEGSVHPIACNIRSEEEVSNLVDETLAKFKRVDFLVNNAGGQFRSLLEDVSLKGWQAVMDTNLNGTFLMTKKVYHAYMKEHGGSIVNIIIVLDKGSPWLAHSAAARAGIESLSKSLPVEWASSGITLNCVAPGIILSSGVENYPSGAEMFEYAAEKATAAKRMGSVEEVSASVLYYLSPAGSYVTGDTMHVDGGWHLMGPLLDVPPHENNHPYDEFVVDIDPGESVADLKVAIKEKIIYPYPAHKLQLFLARKGDEWLDWAGAASVTLDEHGTLQGFGDEMFAIPRINNANLFGENFQPGKGEVHVLLVLPTP
ncbi:hypothetical protein PR001_g8624 [Phytophthora rubi]|uniref:Peroxisomal trans-2-enoyl-CoA reductase n=1 Tax=Phytophthora rubi TaxID=129364 RepID=A0A6A3MUN6_9STRA|nr:hypothetical protein PR001_g8624 [Phytophthora rubi]